MRVPLLLMLALVSAAPLAAKAKKAPAPAAVAVATPAPTPAATPVPVEITVTMKDGQQAHLKMLRYDSVFLSTVNAKGTALDLPWVEIAKVDGDAAGADLALMRGHITDEPSPVNSVMAPRDPGKAFTQALWPGILLHGSGLRYAGDQDSFVSLAGGELFGVVVGTFGLYEVLGPDIAGESKTTANALTIAGGTIFAVTWIWDLALAPGAARRLNDSKGLALLPRQDGLQLSYKF